MKEQIIFDLVEKRAEGKDELINKDFHFIKTLDECDGAENELKKSYRIYHKKGYCIDVSRERHLNRNFEVVRIDYIFCQSWDGFSKIEADEFIKLLKEV